MSWGWWMKPIVWGSFVSDLGVIAKKCPTWPLRSSHCFKGSKISRVSQDLDLDLLYTAGSCHGSLSVSTPRTVTVHFVPRLSRPPDTVVLQSFPRGAAKVGSWGNPRNGGFIAGKIIELNAGCSELGTRSHNYGNSPPSIWKWCSLHVSSEPFTYSLSFPPLIMNLSTTSFPKFWWDVCSSSHIYRHDQYIYISVCMCIYMY